MQEREFDINRELENIYQQLRKSRMIGETTFSAGLFLDPSGQQVDPEFVKFAHSTGVSRLLHFENPRVIRSENFVEQGEVDILNQKVDTIRDLLFQKGKHPDYREWVEDGLTTDSEYLTLYENKRGSFSALAFDTKPASEVSPPYRLSLLSSDNDKDLSIIFNFENGYEFEITFKTRGEFKEIPLIYDASGLLIRMTDVEYKIICFYLDKFMEE